MIEYRTYEGEADELAAFTRRVWLTFFRGRATIPVWDSTYFDWQLLSAPHDRHFLVGAYDGPRLVGSLFGKPFRFRLRDLSFDATMGSWLTVDPDYQGRGIARGLAAEHQRRMQERRCRFLLGFGMPGRIARGTRFWAGRGETVLGGTVCWWAHPIDLAAVGRSEPARHSRLGVRLLALVHGNVRVPTVPAGDPRVTIRPYDPQDLEGCLRSVQRTSESVDLACQWDAVRLAHQLSFKDLPKTIVAEREGLVVGFVNYYPLDLQGRERLRGAIVDHLAADGLGPAEQARLLRSALVEMHESGVQVALASEPSGARPATLLRCGFLPVWPGMRQIYYTADPGIPVHTVRTLRVPLA